MRSPIYRYALLAISLAPAAAEAKPFEEMLPESTTFFFSLGRLHDFEKASASIGLTALWKDPEMRPFARGAEDLLARAGEIMQRKLGLKPADLLDLWQGELAYAIGDPASIDFHKKEMPIAILIDVGDRKDKARELIGKTVELSKLRKRETEFRGDTIVTLEDPKKADSKEGGGELEVSMTLSGEVFAVGLSRPFLQDILAGRGDPALKSLDEHPDFKFLRDRHGKDAWLFGYANLTRWLEQMPRLLQVSGGAAALPMSGLFTKIVADILGAGSFRSVSWAQFHREANEEFTAFAIQSGPLRGFMKTLSLKPQPLRFPAVIPPDAREAYLVLVDWNGFVAALEEALKMARTFAPIFSGEGDESPLEMVEKELGIKIKEDLFGPLGGKLVVLNAPPRTPGTDEYAVLIELKDKERAEETFGKLLAKTPLSRREYLGHPFWSMTSGGGDGGDEDSGGDSEIALCVAGTHVIVSTPRLVEELARREGKEVESLNDSPLYRSLASRVPGATTLLNYSSPEVIEDLIAQIRALPAEVEIEDDEDGDEDPKRGPFEAENRSAPAASPKDDASRDLEKLGEDLVKLFKKLPEGKGLGKHIAASIGWSFVEEKGIGIHGVYGRKGSASR